MRRSRASRRRWPLGLALGAVAALTFLTACLAGAGIWRLVRGSFGLPGVNLGRDVPGARAPQGINPKDVGRVTVLLLGVDERQEDAGRSDTIMVAAMDPARGQLGLISIPRDTWVEIPGHGWDKINHAYAYGGHALALATVQQLLDIPIHHFAVVNFQGFKAIVDAVGGIDLCIDRPMHYDDPYDDGGGLHIHFEPGCQHLDGQKALEYARFRGDGDFHRMARQQQVIRAVLDKAMSPSVAVRIPALVTSLASAIRTDLGLQQMLQLAALGKDVAARRPLQAQVVVGQGVSLHGVDYVLPDLVELRATAYRVLLGSEPPADFLARAQQAHQAMLVALDQERGTRAAVRQPDVAPGALGAPDRGRQAGAAVAGGAGAPGKAPAAGRAAPAVRDPASGTEGAAGPGAGTGEHGTGSAVGGAQETGSPEVGGSEGGTVRSSGAVQGGAGGPAGGGTAGSGTGSTPPGGPAGRDLRDPQQEAVPGGPQGGEGAGRPVPGSGSGGGGQPAQPDDSAGEGAHRPARRTGATVALVDQSGRNLADRWTQALRREGFQVVVVRRAARTAARTLILDYSDNQAVLARLHHLFPWAELESGTSRGRGVQVEIRLGQDATDPGVY